MTVAEPTHLEVATAAARAGGRIIAQAFGTDLEFREKGHADLVSTVDTSAERAIADVIRGAFPRHEILAEEAHRAATDAADLWVVDPLDGTTNFAHGLDHVSVSIAYYREGRPVCGIVHNPIRDDWFVAERGRGAWHNDVRARVSRDAGLAGSLVGVGFYYDRGAMMQATLESVRDLFGRGIHGIRRFGTASLDLCFVGTGVFGAFFEYKLSPWDFAAGRLFVEEAGGRVTTCTGEPLPLGVTTLLASNGPLHAPMLEAVANRAPAAVDGKQS